MCFIKAFYLNREIFFNSLGVPMFIGYPVVEYEFNTGFCQIPSSIRASIFFQRIEGVKTFPYTMVSKFNWSTLTTLMCNYSLKR